MRERSSMWAMWAFVFPFVVGCSIVLGVNLPIGLMVLASIPCIIVVVSRPLWAVLAFIFTWSFGDLLNLPVTPDGFKLSILILLACFSILTTKALIVKDRDLFITPVNRLAHVLMLAMFATSVISILNSRRLIASAREVQEFTYCLLIYFFLVYNIRQTEDLDRILGAFVCAGFLVSLFGLAEGLGWNVYSHLKYHSVFGSTLPSDILASPPNRINGVVGDADFHGSYMGLVFLFSLYLFCRHRSKVVRLLLIVGMLLSVINIFGAGSRGAVLAFILSLVVFWMFVQFRFKWLVPVLIMGAMLIVGFSMVVLVPDLEIERLYSPTGKAKSTIELRKNNVMIGLAMWQHHPVLGQGPDGFAANYNRFAGRVTASAQKSEIKPLNVYVQVMVEYGIIGTFIFLSILFLALRSIFLAVQRLTGAERLLPAVFLSSLCGYAVFMATTGTFANQCYWILIAFSIVASINSRSEIGGKAGRWLTTWDAGWYPRHGSHLRRDEV